MRPIFATMRRCPTSRCRASGTVENYWGDQDFELQYYNHSGLLHSDLLTQERHAINIVGGLRTELTQYSYNKERALTKTNWNDDRKSTDAGAKIAALQAVTAWWEDGNPVKSKCTDFLNFNADTATFMHTYYTEVANKVGFIAPNHIPGTYTVTGEADYAAFLFGILGAAPKNLSASTRRLRFDDEIEDPGTYSYQLNTAGEPTLIEVKYPSAPTYNYTINLRFAKIARE